MRGDFDQVAGDDGDARLEVVKEFVGQAPAVVLAFGLVQREPEVGGLGVAEQCLARHATDEADFGICPALGICAALEVGQGVAGTDDEQ